MSLINKLFVRGGYQLGCGLLSVLPKWPGELALIKFLNNRLAQELEDGDFDFLDDRILEVSITDSQTRLRIGKRGGHFVRIPAGLNSDATIAARASDFLAIASGQEDPDTLFFQRRLSISGDTEFGLTAKNRLDAVDRSRIPGRAQRYLLLISGALAAATQN